MRNIDVLKNHISLTSCNDVREICKPLQRFDIHDFIYLKVYKNEPYMLNFSTNRQWSEFYFDKFYSFEYQTNIVQKHMCLQGKMNINLWCMDENNQMWIDGRSIFNVGNGITIEKDGDNCKEVYYFSSTANNYQINNFYLENIDILENFIFFFKEKAHPLIKLSESNKLYLPAEYLPSGKNINNSNHDFLAALKNEYYNEAKISKYFLGDDFNDAKVSDREIECIKWVILGKSSSEISLIMNISKRTVEAHLNNLKIKLNCYKLSTLTYKLASLFPVIFAESD